ncbi:MAG: hypothetical protein R2788_10300 [Saprospiraceae bacterium]
MTSATNSCTQTASTVVTLNDATRLGRNYLASTLCGDTDGGSINISTVQGERHPYLPSTVLPFSQPIIGVLCRTCGAA